MPSMPSKTPFNALTDIQYNIDLARSFVNGLSFEAFLQDRKIAYAVTSCLEILGRCISPSYTNSKN